jgi:hypothetical protein
MGMFDSAELGQNVSWLVRGVGHLESRPPHEHPTEPSPEPVLPPTRHPGDEPPEPEPS